MDTLSVSIYDYLDYRDFLKEYYKEYKRRHPYFSLRYIAQKTGLDAAHIMRVLQGKRHLSEKSLAGFVALCTFDEKEERYFRALAEFNTARNEHAGRQAFERVLALSGVKTALIQPEQYEFYTKWYHTAIRALIAICQLKNAGEFARIAGMLSPPISVHEARKSVTLLKKLELIATGPDGFLVVTDTHITTGDQWRSLAVGNFQNETLRLAQESLARHDKTIRDISTVTLGISRNQLPALREKIAEFRQSIMRMADENQSPDDIYQMNVQLFPLTDTKTDSKATSL